MKFLPTKLAGSFIIELEPFEDSRGFFARSFCAREFSEHGLSDCFVQCNISATRQTGTVRGMHYQRSPASEAKLVRCAVGALHDVIVDLRPDSPTYLQHIGVELSRVNRRALYVPKMFAHGFQTLVEDTEVFYQMSEYFAPEAGCGIRYDDPGLGIHWPLPITHTSEKDRNWPLLTTKQPSSSTY